MRILLDSHIFIWLVDEPEKLSVTATALLRDPGNELFLSIASVWERQIKIGLGKMRLQRSLQDTIKQQQETNNLQLLHITLPHIFALDALPLHHRDPFDRLLIAQANAQNFALLSADSQFAGYNVNLLA